jgi:xanthine dehydrogenase YagR molybdenum-binding subunit
MTPPSPRRIEASLKVTGRAIFAAETPAEGLLHAVLIEAPIARGKVDSIDASAARRLRGFVDLITHAETQGLAPLAHTALIRDAIIHFRGQPVALVVGVTRSAAEAAAREVRVAYKSEPAVIGFSQAIDQAYEPAMASRYVAKSKRGDAEHALASAHLVLRNRYETAVNNHHPMEMHAVVCSWEGDRATVHTNTQAVFGTRAAIAQAFATPPEKVRVITRFLGGGFGCKGPLWWPYLLLALVAAKRIGRPVRLELTRAQLFTLAGRRQQTAQDLSVGFDKEGKLAGIVHKVVAQTSTHAEYADSTAAISRFLYACPNVTTSHWLVRTNEPQPVPMRAPGIAPGSFALESAMDEAALQFGIDPVELRVRNFADRDQDAGVPWSSNGLLDCYRIGAERFGWSRRPDAGMGRHGQWRLGSGMATTCYPARRQGCKARVALAADGSLLVQCGTQDMGSGTYTALAQLAAETLGIPIDKVTVELGDTLLPEGPFSGGSQVTSSIAPAVDTATAALRAKLCALAVADAASPLFGLPPDTLDFGEGLIRNRSGNAAEDLTALLARKAPTGLDADGATDAPQDYPRTGMGYGAIFVEVGVDTDLGEIRVRRVTAAFAVGRIVNRLLAESQFVGGLVGGIGMALQERTATDRASGRILGDTLADYLIPVHADMPVFDIALVDEHDPHLPGGIKGIGMIGAGGIQAAIANAIFDATGKRIRHLPIRIEDVIL